MPSVPKPPPANDQTTAQEAICEVLLTLVESGCQYVREHRRMKLRVGAIVKDDFLRSDLGREPGVDDDCDDAR